MAAFLRPFFFTSFRGSWKKSLTGLYRNGLPHNNSKILSSFNEGSLANLSTTNTEIMPLNMLEKSLDQLDLDSRYKQRINLRDLEEILQALQHWGTINYHHSLILLKCCGSFSLEVEPVKRRKLLEKTMSLLEDSGVELNINHYNSLLSAYIENENDFSPKAFLDELNKKNLKPNKVTYQRILKAYCQKGDIESASEILEKMKNEDLSLNEDIFNSLIFGHGQVNDMESAAAILDLMNAKGIEPSSESYLNLLCGHAKAGNINDIRRILNECEKKDIVFCDNDLLKIIYIMATNNHLEHIDEILSKMKKNFGYSAHVRYYTLKLLGKNLDSVALKIFESADNAKSLVRHDAKRYGSYMIDYFANYRSIEETLDLCRYLEKKDLLSTPFAMVLKEILSKENSSKAFEMFLAMKRRNMFIRPHYFWPLLILASKEGNHSLLKVIKKMKELRVNPCFYTFSRIVFPNYKLEENWFNDIEKLHEAGIGILIISRTMLKWFLEVGRSEDAVKLASTFPLDYKNQFFVSSLVENLLQTKNAELFVNLVYMALHDVAEKSTVKDIDETESSSSDSEAETLAEFEKSFHEEFVGNVLDQLIKNCDEKLLVVVLEEMLDKNIGISSDTQNAVQNKFSGAEVKELLNKLSVKTLCPKLDDTILNEKKLNNKANFKGDSQWVAQIQSLAQELKNHGPDKAIARLKELSVKTDSERNLSVSDVNQFKFLMMNFAKTGNYEATEKIYLFGIERHVITERNFYPLVHALIVRNDLEKATDLFCKKVTETNCKSSWHAIVSKLIEVQNAQLLQKVTDTMTHIDSEAFSIGMLLSQFANLKKVKEIKKLLDSKQFILPKKSLDYACDWLYKNKSTIGFESLLSMSKCFHQGSYSKFCHLLLKLYIAEKNGQKAVDLWWLMDEQNILPSQFFMKELGVFLQNERIPLPFKLDFSLMNRKEESRNLEEEGKEFSKAW